MIKPSKQTEDTMEKVVVYVIRSYGNEYLHPKNNFAKLVCNLTKKKTIVPRAVQLLKEHNYEIIIEEENV